MKITIEALDFCPDDCPACVIHEELKKDSEGRFKAIRSCSNKNVCRAAFDAMVKTGIDVLKPYVEKEKEGQTDG